MEGVDVENETSGPDLTNNDQRIIELVEDQVTSTTENGQNNVEDANEEDDVPPDFFDDFLNKDFLAGLDVVDAWDDVDALAEEEALAAAKKVDDAKPETEKVPVRDRLGKTTDPIDDINIFEFKASIKSRLGKRGSVNDVQSEVNEKKVKLSQFDQDMNTLDSIVQNGESDKLIESTIHVKVGKSREHKSADRSRGRFDRDRKSIDRSRDRKSGDRLKNRKSIDRSRGRKSADRFKARKSIDRLKDKKSVDRTVDKTNRKRTARERSTERALKIGEERKVEDVRRDPNKTKRDIQRDKDKCAKDKEAKFTSEKLRLVETGLVPPGMEMEANMEEIKQQVDVERRESKERKRSRSVERRRKRSNSPVVRRNKSPLIRRNKSPLIRETRPITRFTPPLRRVIRRNSPINRRNSPINRRNSPPAPRRISPPKHRSPRRKTPRKSRSPVRFTIRQPSPRRRLPSPLLIRERSLERRLNLQSDRIERAIRGRDSAESDRELWLRSKDRSISRISNEMSPANATPRKQTFLEELDQKLNLRAEHNKLKEIQDKINGTPSMSEILNKYAPNQMNRNQQPPPQPNQIQHLQMNPMPVHYPRPMQVLPPQTQQMYDQQFFIGQPDINFQPVPQLIQFQNPHISNMIQPNFPQFNVPQIPPLITPPQQQELLNHPIGQESIKKLFDDEKISLTQFLNVTQRPNDKSTPIDIKNKINVITRCQEAIKIITENSKPSGRFLYKRPNRPVEKPLVEVMNQSPLKKAPPVRLHFTTKSRLSDEKHTSPCSRLLLKMGLRETMMISPCKESPVYRPLTPVRRYDTSALNVLMKMTQTEPTQCKECVFRENIKKSDASTQCEIEVSDFGSQVMEDDFLSTARSALKNLLKNQSFASLTPAQILAQLGHKKPEEIVAPPARKVATPEIIQPPAKRVNQGNKECGNWSDDWERNRASNRASNRFDYPTNAMNQPNQRFNNQFEQPQSYNYANPNNPPQFPDPNQFGGPNNNNFNNNNNNRGGMNRGGFNGGNNTRGGNNHFNQPNQHFGGRF